MNTTWQKSVGGREKYWSCDLKKDRINDCVIRAIAHGTGMDYKVVYEELFALAMSEGNMPNNPKLWEKYLKSLGWTKNSPMKNGRGRKLRLTNYPKQGTYIVRTSGHLTCIKDGVLLDSWDCRDWCGNSYFTPPTEEVV